MISILKNTKPPEPCRDSAISWIRANTVAEKGIVVSSARRVPYLEVTGYLIPTLLSVGENNLARQYAEFLIYMQRPSGAFAGPDGKEYLFDSAQVLRGLMSAAAVWKEFEAPAQKTAEYMLSSMENSGRMPADYNTIISEYVHMYALAALFGAGKLFGNAHYIDAARKAAAFYKKSADVLNKARMTHFLAYIIDGFIEMGEEKHVYPAARDVFSHQRHDGSIPAYPNVSWSCSAGTAQFAIIGYKLGMRRQADKAVQYLCSVQNRSGGFYGSYGRGAAYFPKAEISWANKFFIDAVNLRSGISHAPAGGKPGSARLNNEEWHKVVIGDKKMAAIAGKIRSNDFPIWIRPLLEHTDPGDSLLELGSGSGELSAILGKYGRKVSLLDYSDASIEFSKDLMRTLSVGADFIHSDILKGIPLDTNSVDWVWSSGLLEHFSDEEIGFILKECARVARYGVMSLVPNANSIFYRTGKSKMERTGSWPYGTEMPKFSMSRYFQSANFKNIIEYSTGTYHALSFWRDCRKEAAEFFATLSHEELRKLNQGYLLFTLGLKQRSGPVC